MDNVSSYNQQVQNADISNNSLYQKALGAVNNKDQLMNQLIQEPISLASGEFLQRGLSRVGGAVSGVGKKLGFDFDGVADMIKKGAKPQDILRKAMSDGGEGAYKKVQNLINKANPPTKNSINERFKSLTPEQKNTAMARTKKLGIDDYQSQNNVLDDIQSGDSLQNVKTSFKKATSLGKQRLTDLANRSQGILDENKNKLQEKKSNFSDSVNETKEGGTDSRSIISKVKQRLFGGGSQTEVPFENELTKAEQLDNIRTKLAESKTGRARLRQTTRQEAKAKLQEADKQNLRNVGLEPLEEPTLGERPQGAIKGVRQKPKTIEQKGKEGVASNVDDTDPNEPDEGERLKNIREEDEAKGKYRTPQDKDLLRQQAEREQGYKTGENIATRDQKPIGQILQETIDKTAPPAPKPTLAKAEPSVAEPSVEPAPPSVAEPSLTQKINPASQTGGIDPSTLPADASMKGAGGQTITAQRPSSPVVEPKSDPRLDFVNKVSNLTKDQQDTYDDYRKTIGVEPSDYKTKSRLIDHVKNGTIPEELQTKPSVAQPSLQSQTTSQSTSDSGSVQPIQGTETQTDSTKTFQQTQQSADDQNVATRQAQLVKDGDKPDGEPDDDSSKKDPSDGDGDFENLGEQGLGDLAGEATGGLANLGMGLGLMLLPKLFETPPKSPPPIQLSQEVNPSSQFGDS